MQKKPYFGSNRSIAPIAIHAIFSHVDDKIVCTAPSSKAVRVSEGYGRIGAIGISPVDRAGGLNGERGHAAEIILKEPGLANHAHI